MCTIASVPTWILAAFLALAIALATVTILGLHAGRSSDPASVVLVGTGDIASCSGEDDEMTAKLLDDIPGTVFTTGDNAYPDGSAEDFRECYDPSWGRFKNRTKPTPGNHEYNTEGAEGYFGYFGKAAGEPGKGYYSYDLGAWHLIALNSNCKEVGGCHVSSPQGRWLKADLSANDDKRCTLAYFHYPRFSSGVKYGSFAGMEPFWEVLYKAGADVVLSGHEHNYERFAPQNPYGEADLERGIRQFVVGTGGNGHYEILDPIANSEAHNDDTYGVLKLTLHPTSYDWKFVPVAGKTFTDSGTTSCH